MFDAAPSGRYGHIYVGGPGKHQSEYAHRVAWMVAHDQAVPDGMCVCHTCDVPTCVNPEHLFLGTQLENIADMNAKGRHSYATATLERRIHGAKHYWAKRTQMTEEKVRSIRARCAAGECQRDIAREFGVSQTAINKIHLRINWRHLSDCGPAVETV